MALEGGKYGGKIAVLAGLGIAAVTAGWNVLGDRSEKDKVAVVQHDAEAGEAGEEAEKVEEEDVSGVEAVQADIVQQLKLPMNLPKLHGVAESIPETLLDENKKFLQQTDEWLHLPSEPIDFSGCDEDVQAIVREQRENFYAKVAITEDVMKGDKVFWERKSKLDVAFPNYELVSEPRDDGTFYVHLTEKPGLLGRDARTSSGYEPSSSLEDCEIADLDGGMIVVINHSGQTFSPNDDEDLIRQMETHFKKFELRRKWQNDGEEVPLAEYMKAIGLTK